MMSKIYLAVLALFSIFVWVTSNTVAAMPESEYPGIGRFHPDVVVAHDMGDEYDHQAHAATADVVTQSIEMGADSSDAQNTIREESEGAISSGNIALGKPTAASSIEGPLDRTSAQAVDGMRDTRWSSEHSETQWIQIDLGSKHHITAVVLVWEAAYASVYELQLSDNGTTWTSIFRTSDSNGGLEIIRGLSGTGRYIRMYSEKRATPWGISLWEFEVYGTSTEGLNNEPNAPSELLVG